MPELPDVEVFKNYFLSTSLNQKIKNVEVFHKKSLKGISPEGLSEKLTGRKFKSAFRHGKYMFIEIDKKINLAMHFGMTGFLRYFKNQEDASKHIRIQFNFTNGYHLGYDCARMFGKVFFTENIDDFIKEKDLGIDPFNKKLSFNEFKKLLDKKSGNIKAVLMDQSLIAGIGNVYSDEILFQSSIHPGSSLNKFKEAELKALYNSMNKILKTAVDKEAEYENLPESFLLHHRKKEDDCPKCSGTIKFSNIAGRSSYFCNKHQKKY